MNEEVRAQFNLIAAEYDGNRRKFIPCFDDFYEGATDFIAANIAALSIHHLEDADKAALFTRIHAALPKGGLFVNYDQFCAGDAVMDAWFDRYWEGQLLTSGLTGQDIARWRERRKLDRECSVEREVALLQESGFASVKCVYACQKFAVIAAVK